jgi:peptidyl-prolyl cis-trans isomerase SurA
MRPYRLIPVWFVSVLILLSSTTIGFVADRILAVVNNQIISLSDVRKYREVFMAGARPDDSAVLNELIDQKLLLEEAKKLEISPPSNEQIQSSFNKLRGRFGRPETFNLLKQRLSLTDEEIRQQLEQQLLVQKLVQERITFFVFVSPAEIDTYYDEHPDEFKGQSREAAQSEITKILTDEKGKQKLKDYLDRLRAKANVRINRTPVE